MTAVVWSNPAGGNYNTDSDWLPALHPVAGDIADLSDSLTGTHYVVTMTDVEAASAIFISATNAELDINSGGTITVGKITLAGGTLDLAGGEITGHTTIVFDPGSKFDAQGGTLDGVTWRGTLALTGTLLPSTLVITGGFNVTDVFGSGQGRVDIAGPGAGILFASTMTLDSTVGGLPINIGKSSNLTEFLNVGSDQALTLGGSVTVRQTAAASIVDLGDIADGGTLINNGTLSFNGGQNAAATIDPGRFINAGTIIETGGILNGESLNIAALAGFTNTAAGTIAIAGFGRLGITGTEGAVDIEGTIDVSGTSTVDVNTNATGAGVISISTGSTAHISNFTGTVAFLDTAGLLKLEQPSAYSGTIAGLAGRISGAHDVIDLLHTQATGFAPYVGNAAGGTLTVMNGASVAATIRLAGNYVGAQFTLASDSNGGTDIALGTPAASAMASASAHMPEPIKIANEHVGGAITQAITIANTAPGSGGFENLDGTLGGATAGIAAGGSFTGLAPQAVDSTHLLIGLDTTSSGIKSGTATISLFSDGAGVDGKGQTALSSQTVTVSGTVFSLATPVLSNSVLNFGVIRTGGGAVTKLLGISDGTTVSAFQESLLYSLGALPAGFAIVSGGSGTIASGNDTNAMVSLTPNFAGDFTGSTVSLGLTSTGAGTSSLPDSTLPAQTVTLNGKVYAQAMALPGVGGLSFGVVHVGDSLSGTLTIANTAAGALTDVMTGGFGTVTGAFTGSGNFGAGIAAGSSGTLSVALMTSNSGVMNGSAALVLASHDSEQVDAPVSAGPIALNGTVNNYATAALTELSGGGVFKHSGSVYTLDLGTIAAGSQAPVVSLGVLNSATGQADFLSGTLLASSSGFINEGFDAFSGLGAGQEDMAPTVTMPTVQSGTFSETITLLSNGSNPDFQADLGPQFLTVIGTVVGGQRSMVWTGAGGTNLGIAANWNDQTSGLNPATLAPGATDSAAFAGDGGVLTGTVAPASVAFDGGGAWHLAAGTDLVASNLITVGSTSRDTLLISEGATLAGTGAAGLVISAQSAAAGSAVTVSGIGASLAVPGLVSVGAAGFGSLLLSGGAKVTVGSVVAGMSAAAVGEISVTGAGSSLTVDGSAVVAGSGTGILSILNGATFSAADLTVGALSNSSGALIVSGTGSVLNLTGALNVGTALGIGDLTVGPGAAVHASVVNLRGQVVLEGGLLDPTVQYIAQDKSGHGFGTIAADDIIVEGSIEAGAGGASQKLLVVQGTVLGGGTLTINGTAQASNSAGVLHINAGGTLELTGPVLNAATTTFSDGLASPSTYTVNNSEIDVTFADGNGVLKLDDIAGFAGTITSFQAGDAFVIAGGILSGLGVINGNTLTVSDSGTGGTDRIIFGQAIDSASFGIVNGNTIVACFVAGTRIETVEGQLAVEDLRVGDHVRTHRGDTGAIIWTGQRKIDCRQHPSPASVHPVRVLAGAFGPGAPARDLWLSPDHAVFVEDVLIPVRCLVNDGTIRRIKVPKVTYYHIELPEHDVILAENLPVESYLDTGDRANFVGAGSAVRLFPDFSARTWEMAGYAPLVMTGPVLERVRSRLMPRHSIGLDSVTPGKRPRRPRLSDRRAGA